MTPEAAPVLSLDDQPTRRGPQSLAARLERLDRDNADIRQVLTALTEAVTALTTLIRQRPLGSDMIPAELMARALDTMVEATAASLARLSDIQTAPAPATSDAVLGRLERIERHLAQLGEGMAGVSTEVAEVPVKTEALLAVMATGLGTILETALSQNRPATGRVY